MFGLFRSGEERALDAIIAGCDKEDAAGPVMCVDGVRRRRVGAVLRDVVRAYRKENPRVRAIGIITLIPMILSLIQEIGDAVQRIIDIIRERREAE